MRGQRSKQYRKLMKQYEMLFGFREDYQVLLDAEIIQDAARFHMDLVGGLERTLHGKVKPSTLIYSSWSIHRKLIFQVITQCSIRHLYNSEHKNEALIDQAKTYERRRCNHHLLEEPLSTLECLKSVVDSKDNLTNKHRYVIACQDGRVRAHMRQIPGVPMVVSLIRHLDREPA
jgi:U3 small nucleolar RNA-associated protein 23